MPCGQFEVLAYVVQGLQPAAMKKRGRMSKRQTIAEKLSQEITASRNELPARPEGLSREAKLNGIGGWLLFFCVSFTIVSPAYFVYGFLPISQHQNPSSNNLVDQILGGAMTIYGMVIGTLLWRKVDGIIKRAKWFLIIYAAEIVLSTIYDLAIKSYSWGIAVFAIVEIAYLAAWMLYFSNSLRIKRTFGTGAAKEEAQ